MDQVKKNGQPIICPQWNKKKALFVQNLNRFLDERGLRVVVRFLKHSSINIAVEYLVLTAIHVNNKPNTCQKINYIYKKL